MTNDPKKKPPAPPARKAPEQFIGHDSATMMGDETFADFERRTRASEGAEGATAQVPAHVPAKAPPARPPPPKAPAAKPPPPARAAPPPVADDDDSLPPEAESVPRADPVQETQTLYGVKLPAEYVRFLKDKAYAKHHLHFSPLLTNGRDTFRLRFFVGASLHELPDFGEGEDFVFGNLDDLREENPNLVPIAAFDATGDGEIDSGAVVIDAKKGAGARCPVFQVDDGELEQVAPSLAEFLKSLTPDEPEQEDSDEDDDDEDNKASSGEQHARPGFRPKDRDGVEWDYVTSEGMGFNDEDDDDAMVVERDGKRYIKPDWGGWDNDDWVGFWSKHFEIEQSQEDGDDAFEAALKKHGLRNRNHWKRVTATFRRHYAKDPEFTNAALVARQEQSRAKMRDALEPGMLDPVEGVSLQVWAAVNAKLVSAGGDMATLKKLLAPHKIDEARWAKASEVWNARMSDQSNPDAAMAIATEYGKAFASGGAGAFGASAQAASESMGVNDKVAGKKVKGAEPVPFERWVEIQTAQGVWAQQGKDVNAMLKKVFGMTAVDWSNISAHWSQKLSTDFQLAAKYGELNAKYTEQYAAGDADPDGDLEV